jgi:ribonuclease P protein component
LRLRFTREQRLRRKSEFDATFAGGRRFSDPMFTLTVKTPAGVAVVSPRAARARPATTARLGLAIAARTIGNAVARNRVRRCVRESFRLHQRQLPAVDIVVSAKAAARGANSAALRASLALLWQKVERQCAPSPTP